MFSIGLAAGRLGVIRGGLGARAPGLGFVDGRHQAPLARFGLAQLLLEPLGGSRQAIAALLERFETRLETRHLGLSELDAGPKGAQLAADLRRLAIRPRDALGQAGLECLPLLRQLGLGRVQAVGLGDQVAGRGVDLGQLAGDARRLSLQGGDEGVIDER